MSHATVFKELNILIYIRIFNCLLGCATVFKEFNVLGLLKDLVFLVLGPRLFCKQKKRRNKSLCNYPPRPMLLQFREKKVCLWFFCCRSAVSWFCLCCNI